MAESPRVKDGMVSDTASMESENARPFAGAPSNSYKAMAISASTIAA